MASDTRLPGDIDAHWAGPGRGLHVDFGAEEIKPLEKDLLLGRGRTGAVYETTVQKQRLALKIVSFRRKLGSTWSKEIDILKKLRHHHFVRLVGSYTHNRSLGILLWPVAVCDLQVFFEDAEAHWKDLSDEVQNERLKLLHYRSLSSLKHKAWPVYPQIGCLISAVAYLHSQKVRHKDLKPSNILLTPDRIYISDFDTATGFSLLSQSATDGGGGTPRYRAPEMAAMEPSGRPSDMFSLGCVLLEILVFDQDATLQRLRSNPPMQSAPYHSNLDRIEDWLPRNEDLTPMRHLLYAEIRAMLSKDETKRPRADQLVLRIGLCEKMMESTEESVFADCCRIVYSTEQQFQSRIKALQARIDDAEQEKCRLQHEVHDALEKAKILTNQALAEQAKRLNQEHRSALERAWWIAEQNFAEQADRLRSEHHDTLEKAWWLANESLAGEADQTRSKSCECRPKNEGVSSTLDTKCRNFGGAKYDWRDLESGHQVHYTVGKIPVTQETAVSLVANYYSRSRVDMIVHLTTTCIVFVLLVLPVVAIYKQTPIGDRNFDLDTMGVFMVFTLLFSASMSFLTMARWHKLFATSPSYCAVLVGFTNKLVTAVRAISASSQSLIIDLFSPSTAEATARGEANIFVPARQCAG